MYVKNCWYAAAWDHEISSTSLLARKLLDEDVILYRRQDGSPVAMIDRCTHRLAPLSKGRLEGECVRCMYHGLLFDPGGECVDVPQQEKIPPNLTVRTFPLLERDKYIWIWMGEPALADPALVPDCHWQVDPAWRSLPGYVHYEYANYRLIMDNLLDFSHLGFVHEGSLGGSRLSAEVRPKVERFDWGVRITRKYTNDAIPPFLKNLARFEGLADRWQIYDWQIAGNILSMDSGVAPAGTGALEGTISPLALVFHAIQALTPETDTSTHYFWTHAHNFEIDKPEVTQEVARQVANAFAEDKAIIQAQQAVLAKYPDQKMVSIGADAAVNMGRWLLDRRIASEAVEPIAAMAAAQ